jgi:heme A synthase
METENIDIMNKAFHILLFICLYNVSKKNNTGYILLAIILSMLIIVGIMVIVQAIFQIKAGIDLPIEAILTKIGAFVVLGIIAAKYEVKLFKNI